MVIRLQPEGRYVCVTQPAHAWLAGQLARAWGNQWTGDFHPWEEVCLAAEQHDIGWLAWEQAPELNPETGRPYDFMTLPGGDHRAIWSQGVRQMMLLSRYAALLVSLHHTGLCRRFSHPESESERREIRRFLADQEQLQTDLKASLEAEPEYRLAIDEAVLQHNQRLVAVWDTISLWLCMGMTQGTRIDRVPSREKEGSLQFQPMAADSAAIEVTPWPFAAREVRFSCEGRRLEGRFETGEAMRDALRVAPVAPLAFRLSPPPDRRHPR